MVWVEIWQSRGPQSSVVILSLSKEHLKLLAVSGFALLYRKKVLCSSYNQTYVQKLLSEYV